MPEFVHVHPMELDKLAFPSFALAQVVHKCTTQFLAILLPFYHLVCMCDHRKLKISRKKKGDPCCNLSIIFSGFISHLMGRKTINNAFTGR